MNVNRYNLQMRQYNHMNDYSIIKELQEYINDELHDSKYYSILAKSAPTKNSKELLLEFSNEEKIHAQNFMKAYFMLTGNPFQPHIIEDFSVPEYNEALKLRILAETTDYKKYGNKYLSVYNPYLKDIFYAARTDEARHAMRIPILMEESRI